MKELSIIEKARRYDKAIELVNSKWHYKNQPCVIDVSEIFPELKETKVKNIRKWFIKYFQTYKSEGIKEFADGLKIDDIIAWFEKQDEQKFVDNVELKFKIGDWVVINNNHQSIYQVEKIENGYYILRHTHGGTFRVCILHDESLRLWTINDARWGDILASKDKRFILIFKHLDSNKEFSSYYNTVSKINFGWSNKCFIPATKEQCDLLVQNMKEKDYKWNDNTKEVIKL